MLFAIAAFGMFFYHYANTSDLRFEYANDSRHFTDLASLYTRHYEKHGTWPTPGTYSENGFQYKSTAILPTGEREDAYYTDYDGGMGVHFELRKDGTIQVWPFPD